MKKVLKFLQEGDRVKLLMQFRGREMAHKDIGMSKFREIIEAIQTQKDAVLESHPKFMRNRVIAMIAPSKKS